MSEQEAVEQGDFGSVPWFAEMGVPDQKGLLAEFDVRKRSVMDPQKVKDAHAQCSFKAKGVLALLWCDEAGRQGWWTPGDVDGMFRFLEAKSAPDMGPGKRFYNQDHRVCCLFCRQVTDYASFQADENVYAARKARGYMTGVRLAHEMYRVYQRERSGTQA